MSDDLFDVFNEKPSSTGSLANSSTKLLPLTHKHLTESNGLSGLFSTDALSQSPYDNDIVLLDDVTSTSFRTLNTSTPPTLASSANASQHEAQREPRQQQQQQHVVTATPSAITSPLPLPFSSTTTTFPPNSASSNGAVIVIRSSPASFDGRGDEIRSDMSNAPPPASAVFTEPHSRIRVRRATVALEQLAVRLAEFPYASFALFRQAACRNGAQTPVPLTCVGVATRKSDPKQSATQTRTSRYAVLTLWNMENISPSAENELSFLLCGDAFDLLYSQLVRGSVLALSNVAMCPRKGSSNGNGGSSVSADFDVLLRVSDHTAVRQLGFAADLGTCISVSHKSNERCHVVVNTLHSQHCSYHVGDLRKVARGTSGNSSGSTLPSSLSAHRSVSSSFVASKRTTTAIMKGGTLTSHMMLTPTVARRGITLTPDSTTKTGPSLITTPKQQQSLHHPVNARLAASQQLLRQPSFFAVRGATGLPVEDAARRRDLNSAGSGVYGGVQGGAPLPLKQKVGLCPSERYPTAQELGVTSRGRDVLEAARQQAVLSEEEKLLRRSLKPAEQKKISEQPYGSDLSVVLKSSASSAADDDITGGKARDARAAAVRLRERDSCEGTTSINIDSAQAFKRARADAVPRSAVSTTSAAVPMHSSTLLSSSSTTAATDANRVHVLRAQFQPLHRGTPAAFAPLSGHSSVHSVISSAVKKNYRHTVVMAGGGAVGGSGSDTQRAMLRAAAKAAKDAANPKRGSNINSNGSGGNNGDVSGDGVAAAPVSNRSREDFLTKLASDDSLPLTLLGVVASSVQSQHDHLRSDAEKQRLLSFVDKQITKEKALEALEAVSQQEVKAHYCYGCRCWYMKPPTTCIEQHHRTELKPALKKYIKCEHCGYKTFVIGGKDAKGWKVFPRCPRCHEASLWVRGDAAPQIAGPVEEPTPY